MIDSILGLSLSLFLFNFGMNYSRFSFTMFLNLISLTFFRKFVLISRNNPNFLPIFKEIMWLFMSNEFMWLNNFYYKQRYFLNVVIISCLNKI